MKCLGLVLRMIEPASFIPPAAGFGWSSTVSRLVCFLPAFLACSFVSHHCRISRTLWLI